MTVFNLINRLAMLTDMLSPSLSLPLFDLILSHVWRIFSFLKTPPLHFKFISLFFWSHFWMTFLSYIMINNFPRTVNQLQSKLLKFIWIVVKLDWHVHEKVLFIWTLRLAYLISRLNPVIWWNDSIIIHKKFYLFCLNQLSKELSTD